jgi:SAM-dependent methyltransferase
MSYDKYAREWHKLQAETKNNLSHKYLEKPAIKSLLPAQFRGNILLVGCGSGEEISQFEGWENTNFYGIDSSEGLVYFAKNNYPEYKFFCDKIEDWETDIKFDFIYSSLTFHYIEDWNKLFTKLHRFLNHGGEILFSMHHPIKWCSETIRNSDKNSFILGYEKEKKTGSYKIYGDYLNPREINDRLFGKIDIKYYHKPFSEIVNTIHQNNFKITEVVEPKPIGESKLSNPDFYETYSKIPLFMIFKLKKI